MVDNRDSTTNELQSHLKTVPSQACRRRLLSQAPQTLTTADNGPDQCFSNRGRDPQGFCKWVLGVRGGVGGVGVPVASRLRFCRNGAWRLWGRGRNKPQRKTGLDNQNGQI